MVNTYRNEDDSKLDGHHLFNVGYFDIAVQYLDKVIARAAENLANVDFDTLVGTGVSGALVVPALALKMGKSFVIVRKDNDGSHHRGKIAGTLGKRWVFVDDFISSGKTRKRVIDTIEEQAGQVGHQSYYVGDYCYTGWQKHACRCNISSVCVHRGTFTPAYQEEDEVVDQPTT